MFEMALTFDGKAPFNVQGSAVNQTLVKVPMPKETASDAGPSAGASFDPTRTFFHDFHAGDVIGYNEEIGL
jgi:hypothetical protein